MLGVVCDTNIYVSAFNFDGLPEQILREAEFGRFSLYISPAILKETTEVLRRKFGWTTAETALPLRKLTRFTIKVRPKQRLHILADEPDNRILECAVAATAHVIISGDKLLLQVGQFRGIRLVSPRAFITEYPLRKAA